MKGQLLYEHFNQKREYGVRGEGHFFGKDDAKKGYEQILRDDYNILVHWQIPNSPETNLLDLGAWMALQCIVEKKHRLKLMDKDILAKTIEENFACLLEDVLERIHTRWLKVLDLILKDSGSNDLVEKDRGLTSNLINLTTISDDTGEEDVIATDGTSVNDGFISDSQN